MTLDSLVKELLMRGAADWVSAAEVAWTCKSTGEAQSLDSIRRLAVRAIRMVLDLGLMEVGDLDPIGRTFRKWELATPEAVERIDREWTRLGRSPQPGDLFWLSNTAKGDARNS